MKRKLGALISLSSRRAGWPFPGRSPAYILAGSVFLYVLAILAAPTTSYAARPALDSSVTSISVTGEVVHLYGDYFSGRPADHLYFLEDKKNNRRYRLHFDKEPPGHLRTGTKVTVHGRPKGKDLYLQADGVVEQDPGVASLMQAQAAVSGEQRTITFVANFNDADVSCSVSSVEDLMFTDPLDQSVDDYYQETSLGAVQFTGDVVGPLTIDYPSSGCDLFGWIDAIEAQAGVDLSQYSRRIYVLPENNGCGYVGIGSVGGTPPSISAIFRCDTPDVYAHELGHNLGMVHASTDGDEYGDTTDIMGYSGVGLRQLNAPHQEQMGWRSPELIVPVTNGGFYDIAPIELDSHQAQNPQILKIAKPGSEESYYISYRQQIGFDSSLSSELVKRVHIHRYLGNGTQTFFISAPLEGQSFTDTANNIKVTHISHNSEFATVQVELDGSCTAAAPQITLNPGSQNGEPGEMLTYSVAVTNNDSSNCGNSTFSLSGVEPAGWTGSISASLLELAPGQTGSATLTVASSTSATAGAYGLEVNVAGESAVHNGSATAEYVVQEQCSPGVPTVAISPASQSSAPGGTLVYNVSLRNNDNANCASTSFTLNSSVPSGWTGSMSPSSLNLASGQSGTATLSVTSPASGASGSYGLGVNVSGSDALHSVSASAEYIVAEQCTMSVPTITLAPSSQSGDPGAALVYTVSLTNRDSSVCSASSFSLERSLPAGWSGTVVPASLSLAPGANGSANLTVTSSETATAGAYSVRIDVGGAAAHTTGISAIYEVNEVVVAPPPADTVAPTAPGSLQVAIKRKSNNLSWSPSSDNVGVVEYRIWRDNVMIAEVSTSSYSDRSISYGTIYSYWVTAYDAAGNESDLSNVVDTAPTISSKPPKKK